MNHRMPPSPPTKRLKRLRLCEEGDDGADEDEFPLSKRSYKADDHVYMSAPLPAEIPSNPSAVVNEEPVTSSSSVNLDDNTAYADVNLLLKNLHLEQKSRKALKLAVSSSSFAPTSPPHLAAQPSTGLKDILGTLRQDRYAEDYRQRQVAADAKL